MFTVVRQFTFAVLALLLCAETALATPGGPATTWTYGDSWIARVAWEAKWALHEAYATNNTLPPATGISLGQASASSYYGTNNYTVEDAQAFSSYSAETTAYSGSPTGSYVSGGVTYYRGGECTFFIGLVLYRATYWGGFGKHLAVPNFPDSIYGTPNAQMTRSWATVQPGWIFIKKPGTGGSEHMAIAEKRETINGMAGWWFIDSNYVGNNQPMGYKTHVIGRHFLPDGQLNDQSYWAWKPNLATPN